MEICNQWFSSFLLTKPFEEVENEFRAQIAYLKEMGAKVIGDLEQSYSVQGMQNTPVFGRKYVMNEAEWETFCGGMNRLGKIAKEEYGITLTFHHHMGTVVQNADEVERMMENTDPEYVSLLFDTGHFAYCGTDPLEMVKKYADRIKHVHLKDIRREVVEKVKEENLSFLDGVRMGTFTVPGDGDINFELIFQVLEESGYVGYCTQVANARVKTLADPFMSEETTAWAKSMGVENVTKDYKEILADPEIDAVLICSSTDTHSSIFVEAIKAGKHAFCEKPIDHDVAKIKEVVEALKESDVKYQVGFNRRFEHNFEAVQRAVAEGRIGDTHLIKVTSRDPEPPCAEYVKVSGGMFLDMTIHDFDMVRFLAGCNAEEVYVEAAVLVDLAIGETGDVDTAVITLKMENGAIAVIDNSRKAVYGYDQRAEVFGSKGMAAVTNDTASSAVIRNADGVTGEKPLFFLLERYMAAYAKEIKCFIEAIESDTDIPIGVMDGLEPVLMGVAAKNSMWMGTST